MKPARIFSMEELRLAKARAKQRFLEVAEQCKPEGYSFVYRKTLTGMHYGTRKLIVAPLPTTRNRLYIFLHECGHAHLGHFKRSKRKPRHVEEMEAEQWAHAKMREHGIPVPRKMTQRAKRYVAHKIDQAERRGAKRINPEARRYAKR